MSVQMPATGCPVCLNLIDAASGLHDASLRPGEGDVTVCFFCAALLEYDAHLMLVRVSTATIVALGQVRYIQLLALSHQVKNRPRGKPSTTPP